VTTGIHPLLAVFVAWIVAALASLGGLSGAFLLVPFQLTLLGVAGPVVTPTTHLYNVLSIPTGALRYAREGRLLWPLACAILLGSLPGVVLGALVRMHWLEDAERFRTFVGLTLLAIAMTSLARMRSRAPAATGSEFTVQVTRFDPRGLAFRFQGREHELSLGGLVFVTLFVGVIGGAYGIGGGALIAPLLVSFWRLPVHAVAGATLMATFLTSACAVLSFWALDALGGLEGARRTGSSASASGSAACSAPTRVRGCSVSSLRAGSRPCWASCWPASGSCTSSGRDATPVR
jgi:uncharacterized membrane protein YfcA